MACARWRAGGHCAAALPIAPPAPASASRTRTTAPRWSPKASRSRAAAAPSSSAIPTPSTAAPIIPSHDPAYRAEGIASWYGARFPRPQDRQWRSLRHERDLGRASDHADAELCARDQSGERPLHRRAGQRSRALCPRPDHRSVDRHGEGARDLRAGAGAGARRICRPRRACRQRRQRPAGDACGTARRRPRQSSIRLASSRPSILGGSRDPDATPLPPERPFVLGDATVRAPAPARHRRRRRRNARQDAGHRSRRNMPLRSPARRRRSARRRSA